MRKARPGQAAQSLQQDVAAFVETPAVTGYESADGGLAAEIRSRLKSHTVQNDNLGNLYVTLGAGSPHRLIIAPMDEPGYVVSGITDDGYLRVQRLPQQAPHGLFDQLHAAQPVVIHTRTGKRVYGVVAGLSTHLQPGRREAPRVAHPDEIAIDIGAATAEEARQAGVDLLDPIALDRRLYEMGFGKITAPAIGDRFGVAALVELLRRIDAAKLRGTLTAGFVAQQWAGSRGLDRLTQHLPADEMIYVGRLLPRRAGVGSQGPPRAPHRGPGTGVLIGTTEPEAAPAGLAAELLQLGDKNKINVATHFSAALPRVSYTQGPALPERFVHLAIPTKWPSTPAEVVDFGDLENLVALLELYLEGSVTKSLRAVNTPGPIAPPSLPARPETPPAVTAILQRLVESYGVSGHEGPVRESIARLLPPWAKAETDAAGNLILRVASAPVGSKAVRIVFVAHSDEIGFEVRSIVEDGGLVVESRGGGIQQFFVGHAVFVHTAGGIRPGVLELPPGWDGPGFEWPRGPQAVLRVDVGARTAAEAGQLGIRVGDSITVPKKYRTLVGTRATGRSFDDRVGCAVLVAAAWALGPTPKDRDASSASRMLLRDVTFLWSTEEELGLRGAFAAANRLAAEGRAPDYVFAVDTFVSSDSPLESKRFAYAPIGKGFVIRAVDNSNVAPREWVDRLVQLARANNIPVQYGVTGGGNDGAAFLRYGAIGIPISWPLRYSHSPGEVIDTRDVGALARIVAAIARDWPPERAGSRRVASAGRSRRSR